MSRSEAIRTLVTVRRNDRGTIVGLPDDPPLRSQCIRLGLALGTSFLCIERLPGGTVVVETGRQEIALGRSLAETLHVEVTGEAGGVKNEE